MKLKFCDKCYKKQRKTCSRICSIVEAELTSKGVYQYKKDHETKKYTLELEPKQNEIDIVFMHEIDMELVWSKTILNDKD